tara:strand:+ start:1284 stop:2393 length:1110 start_codon:yes stop_codon:yes gene_type:complete
MKKRKILYISGTRADYGLMRNTLFSIKKHPKLAVEIAATGMHLMPEFGKTINEIKKDNFRTYEIREVYRRDSKESMADFIGKFITSLTKKIKKIKPDIILLLGDRAEMLVGAVVGTYLTIPVAQVHGGDVTSTVDEFSRHAITKLSHIHLPASKKSAERIIKMGEDPWRVFVVGAPGLDSIPKKKKVAPPLILVLQHPVSLELTKAARQMKETMEAVKELRQKTIVIYPNADAGGRRMIKVIEKYRKYPFIKIFKNIAREEFLNLMARASCLVGNSSSGFIETPSFKLAAVNVGKRQEGRERAENIIDVDYDKIEIKRAIRKAIHDKKFKARLARCKNPYGDGKTGHRIAKILSEISIDKKLLDKKLTY